MIILINNQYADFFFIIKGYRLQQVYIDIK